MNELVLCSAMHVGAGVRVGGHIPAVPRGAGEHVVAVQPRAGLPLQVHLPTSPASNMISFNR